MKKYYSNSLTYKDAGVDIDAGEKLVNIIKPLARKTIQSGVLSGIGGFGALFELPKKFKEPVLVSGTDGVGTKLKLAFEWQKHDTIGIDLVAMSVNDILTQGAEPLFFLDYFACGKLSLKIAESVISGIVRGCQESECTLIGGETAEMPGMYPEGEYDLGGFAVGAVEKSKIITGDSIIASDKILGLASSGGHSNGYSLIRKIINETGKSPEENFYDDQFGEVILRPTKIYVKSIKKILRTYESSIKGLAHITGGGLIDNIPRILKEDLTASIDQKSWDWPNLFKWLQEKGNISNEEMYRVFNCGIGMIVIVQENDVEKIKETLELAGEKVFIIGQINKRRQNEKQVLIK